MPLSIIMLSLGFLCLIFLASFVSAVPGGKEKIILTGMSGCKMETKSAFKIADNVMDMDLDFPAGFDDSLTVNVELESGGEGKWKSIMKSTGPACKSLMQYLSPLMKRIAPNFEPSLPAKCPFKKGLYKLKGLDATFQRSDFNVPSLPAGNFKLSMIVKDKSNKIIFCSNTDAIVKLI